MMAEQREDFGIGLIFMFAAVVLVAVWFNWVQERDKFLYSVMDCMQESSQEEYNQCAKQVSFDRGAENGSW